MHVTALENDLVNKPMNVNGVSATYRLALSKFFLGTVKVKVHIQAFHKLCDGVLVGVRLLKKTEEKWMTLLLQQHTFIRSEYKPECIYP